MEHQTLLNAQTANLEISFEYVLCAVDQRLEQEISTVGS